SMHKYAEPSTLEFSLAAGFGAVPFDPVEGRQVLKNAMDRMPPAAVFSPAFRKQWYPPWRRYLAARAAFDAWIDVSLQKHRDSETAGSKIDMIGMLLEAR